MTRLSSSPTSYSIYFLIIYFFLNFDLNNYPDDSFTYASSQKLEEIKLTFHCDFEKVRKWFYKNSMVLNQGKCDLTGFGKNTENETLFFFK